MESIRIANLSDALAISEIYKPYVEQTAISFETIPPNENDIKNRITNVLKKHVWLVYEIDEEVVAYAYSAAFRERKAYQWIAEASVYIDQIHQRKGIGSKLYSALHKIMTIQGYTNSYAGMTVPNEASRNFHLSLGYESLAYFQDIGYKFGKWHSTEWFSKTLNSKTNDPSDPLSIDEISTSELNKALIIS